MSEIILRCKDISFKYFENSKREVISGFSFSFEKGEIYLITGISGCGKSSLAYISAGLYPENKGVLTGGSVTLLDKSIKEYSIMERTKTIMMMFQNADSQFCMEKVKDEIVFTLENIKFPVDEIEKRVEEILNTLDIEYLREREISELSGGEKQKVALACVLAVNPQIIVLDEPFANLDSESSEEILQILKRINKENETTIIAVDHRLSLWRDTATKTIYLEKGCKISKECNGLDLEDKYNLKEMKKIYLEDSKIKNKIIEIKNLKLTENKTLSLDIERGKITALLGKSGIGKTTILKTISGLRGYKEGKILIEGKDRKSIKLKNLIDLIGIIFQNPQNQFVTYKVIDEIIFTLKRVEKNSEKIYKIAESLLERFKLKEYKEYSPFILSQGQQRKLAVLSMICSGQRIILCDEPTYAQDNKTSREIMEFLKKRCEEEGVTVVVVSHNTELMLEYADRIYEMNKEGVREVRYERV